MPLYRYFRKIMWFSVGPSNNDPAVIARYYLKCVEECGGKLKFQLKDQLWARHESCVV